VQTPRGSVYLINVHLSSPHGALLEVFKDSGKTLAANAHRRWTQSEAVRTLTEEVQGPVVLAGDFNTTDDSPIFREHWADFADGFAERGSGFGYTYLINHTQLRIDHILADPSWKFIHCWVGPQVGSPHRPLVADLQVR
jgi:vancomycin resistance protein VanJ